MVTYIKNRDIDHPSTFLGKTTIFSVMVLFLFELFELMKIPYFGTPTVVHVLEFVCAAIVLASIVDKIIMVTKEL